MASNMSIVRRAWPGAVQELKHLIVFGASYCDVGYDSRAPRPSPERPMGVDFPGKTWCGSIDEEQNKITYEPNWVGHLVELFRAQQKVSSLLVYNYALGGETASGVKRQIEQEFMPHVATKPDWAPWTSDDTVFVTWVGINDCAWNADTADFVVSTKASVATLFLLQEKLYRAGARNFCFVDVPPTYDHPGIRKPAKLKDTILTWNVSLRESAERFSEDHADVTVFIWSAFDFFTRLLTDPRAYGFREEDTQKAEGAIFVDGLHPTSRVHLLMAQEILQLLSSAGRPGRNVL
ncbi:carbohydrate esterase family 16 protein [Trametes coccinea BRFM310]|uniref:Carbohydrate esterase family 16 protein n=1 Tax=Trametes coccinea (strain BRFM310) TaxID=1353009 RepID=A0A1Y2IUU0_TRAC3|nr:carbohydrate esterase family 16 protein [Trametes coccinea BRFM310]